MTWISSESQNFRNKEKLHGTGLDEKWYAFETYSSEMESENEIWHSWHHIPPHLFYLHNRNVSEVKIFL